MNIYSRIVVAVMIALGLGLSACSQDVETDRSKMMVSSDVPEVRSVSPGMHSAVSAEDVTVTVNSAYTAKTVDMHPRSGIHDDIQPEASREDGIFVVVETTVKNESGADMDLTCASTGANIYTELKTDQEAVYKPVGDLYLIPGNPECNHNLGSGFDTAMTWVFQIPAGDFAKQFGFAHSESAASRLTWINLDQISDVAPTPSTATLTKESQEPAETSAEENAQEPVPDPDVPQQIINPFVAPAPAPAAPAYGASCPVSMVQQPGQAADGSSLVCIYAGTDSPVWVYAPEPYGVGTATPGGTCEGYEAGGQDMAGRMMMCSGGQWIYGP